MTRRRLELAGPRTPELASSMARSMSPGTLVAMGGAVLGWYALTLGSLWLLCTATFVCGLYNAFGASLRFDPHSRGVTPFAFGEAQSR